MLAALPGLALAASLGSTVPSRSTGVGTLTFGASDDLAYRRVDPDEPALRETLLSLRADLVPLDGLGLWVSGARRTSRLRTLGYSGAGFEVQGGVRSAIFVGRWLGLGAVAAAGLGRETSSGGANSRALLSVDVGAQLLVGAAGGPHAWLGVGATPYLSDTLVRGELETRLRAPSLPLQLCVGTELWSDDIVSPPARVSPRLAIGTELRMLSGFGLSAWISVGL